jgi:hypothetical protein
MTELLRGEHPRFFVSDGIGQYGVYLLVTQWFRPLALGLDALRSLK